jgi:hypothetical protein
MKPGLFFLLFLVFAGLAVAGAQTPGNLSQRKTAEAGGVTVSVTLLPPGQTATIDFQLVLDTHAGALPADMLKVAKLREEGAREVSPLAWSGGKGGHHLAGKLSFPAAGLAPAGKAFTLLLQGVGGRNDLRFEWTATTGGI